jgi:hypothetical protein
MISTKPNTLAYSLRFKKHPSTIFAGKTEAHPTKTINGAPL